MPETRWLSDEEQRTWRAYLHTSQLLQEALERQLQRDSGMPHAYYMILAVLSESQGRTATMTQLASVLQFSASRLSHAISRLEEKGWVQRVKRPGDRRKTMAQLTEEGFAALAAAAPGHVAEVRRALFDPLTREQMRDFHAALVTILSAVARTEAADDSDPTDETGNTGPAGSPGP
jgi:DNA-binding MarR family transcriptional regulator